MPQVRKLSADEVTAIQNKGKGTRKIVEEQYDAIMTDYAVGDYGEAIIDPGENRLTVRNRLRAAARRANIEINYQRTNGDMLRFKIVEPGSNSNGASKRSHKAEATPPPEPVKRKGG